MLSNLYLARTRGLPILTQIESVEAFPRLRETETAIAAAGIIAERVDALTAEDESVPGIFDVLNQSLRLLDQGTSPDRVRLVFGHRAPSRNRIQARLQPVHDL